MVRYETSVMDEYVESTRVVVVFMTETWITSGYTRHCVDCDVG